MLSVHDIPGEHQLQVAAIAHAAATATEPIAQIRAPFKCVVTEVGFIPNTASTGDNTNTTNLNVIDRGTGAGTTEIANKDLVSGENLVANTPKVIGTGLSVAMDEGDVLSLVAEKVGSGVAVGAGTFYAKVRGA